MTGTDDFNLSLTVFRINLRINLFQSLGKHIQSGCRSLLHKKVTIVTMSKCIDNEIYRIVKSHHEASHIRIGNGNGLT